jgi:hypothetical protein
MSAFKDDRGLLRVAGPNRSRGGAFAYKAYLDRLRAGTELEER